jgi:vanillate O-demethylase monooxygenase subunit
MEMNNIQAVVPRQAEGEFTVPGLPRDEESLPDAFAPFIRNCWYVVAESRKLGRELHAIRVVGEPLVLYRTEAGEVVVLDDRCAHRRYPLSKSKLVGDTVQCGYHGFTYEKTGRCVWAPTSVVPNFGVRRYPSVEVGPWVWAWMGDPAKADPAKVPYPPLDPNENWRHVEGYKHNYGNYMLLIENLLDLSHLHFLHGEDVADIAQSTSTSKRLTDIVNGVGYTKETPVVPAKMLGAFVGYDPTKLVRLVTTSRQVGPSINYGTEDRFPLNGDQDPIFPMRFFIAHAITPETMTTTHQFFQGAFNREFVGDIDLFRQTGEDIVFEQDSQAMALMQEIIETDKRTGTVEFGIAGDRYGVAMRGILRKMKQEELGASP